MAMSIGQIDIEMQDAPAPPSLTSPEAKAERPFDLQAMMAMLQERKLRLQAD